MMPFRVIAFCVALSTSYQSVPEEHLMESATILAVQNETAQVIDAIAFENTEESSEKRLLILEIQAKALSVLVLRSLPCATYRVSFFSEEQVIVLPGEVELCPGRQIYKIDIIEREEGVKPGYSILLYRGKPLSGNAKRQSL